MPQVKNEMQQHFQAKEDIMTTSTTIETVGFSISTF